MKLETADLVEGLHNYPWIKKGTRKNTTQCKSHAITVSLLKIWELLRIGISPPILPAISPIVVYYDKHLRENNDFIIY